LASNPRQASVVTVVEDIGSCHLDTGRAVVPVRVAVESILYTLVELEDNTCFPVQLNVAKVSGLVFDCSLR